MAIMTKDQLKTQSNSTFTTNGQGAITASSVRNFNVNLIDSLVTSTAWTDANITSISPYLNFRSLKIKDFGDFYIIRFDMDIDDMDNWVKISNFTFSNNHSRIIYRGTPEFHALTEFTFYGKDDGSLGITINGQPSIERFVGTALILKP